MASRVADLLPLVAGDGAFSYEMDSGAVIRVASHVDRDKREATIDFTGTSTQQPTNFNAPSAVCKAAVLYVFRTLVDDEIPMNAGCLKPLSIVMREGSMLSPRYPAAVVAGNVETSQAITDSRLTDPEVLEWRFPVRLESYAIRRGSGDAGRHRGGDGGERRVRFLEPMTAVMLANRRRVAPFGLNGGESGALGRNWVERADGWREEFGATFKVEMCAGDVIVIQTPGGGGFGTAGSPA